MFVARLQRIWRRAAAKSRFTFYRYLTRRATRTMRRSLIIVLLIIAIFALYDLRRPRSQRLVKRTSLQVAPLVGSTLADPRSWPTWAGINTIFVFGDSQSDTGFNPHGPQPDSDNPLGNPAWPGITSSYGPNFVGHLTATFNSSMVRTYNLANKRGAITSKTEQLNQHSLVEQIEEKFLSRYGPSKEQSSRFQTEVGTWSQIESLFIIYSGVDDLLYTTVARYGGRNTTTIMYNIEAYYASMEKLYQAGARNFLLINFPQLEEAPFMRNSGVINYIWDFGAEIVQYNGRLAFMAHRFAEKHLDANVFVFDNHKMSLAIRQEPGRYPDTASYVRMSGFCFPYVHDIWWTETHRVFDQQCEVPLDGWYWRDDTHVTEPYHKLMARRIVELLDDPSQRLPLEFY